MTLSVNVKSNLPSFGSNKSQYAGTNRVLSPVLCSLGKLDSMSSTDDAEELPNSPPSMRKGLLSIRSCVEN